CHDSVDDAGHRRHLPRCGDADRGSLPGRIWRGGNRRGPAALDDAGFWQGTCPRGAHLGDDRADHHRSACLQLCTDPDADDPAARHVGGQPGFSSPRHHGDHPGDLRHTRPVPRPDCHSHPHRSHPAAGRPFTRLRSHLVRHHRHRDRRDRHGHAADGNERLRRGQIYGPTDPRSLRRRVPARRRAHPAHRLAGALSRHRAVAAGDDGCAMIQPEELTMKNTALLATLAVSASLIATAAQAETRLKVADSFPTSHYISVEAAKKFMDEATRLSNGELQFDYFPTEQLGKAKDLLQLTTTGLTDIAYIVPSYAPDKLRMSYVAELPGMDSHSCEGTHAFWKLIDEGGILNREEFEPNGVVPLMGFALPPYQISVTAKPLDGIDALKGQKIRAAGGAFELTLRALEAVPVRMAAP